jgi:hypothetical protein
MRTIMIAAMTLAMVCAACVAQRAIPQKADDTPEVQYPSSAAATGPGATSTIAVVTPATNPSPTTASAPAIDPRVAGLLAKCEAAGNEHKTIRANLNLSVEDKQLGDTEERTGWLAYQKDQEKTAAQAGSSAKFRIRFDTRAQGNGPKKVETEDYAFDGYYFTVKKEQIKEMTRYQVATEGQKIEPLRLGHGPFPLPFGQKAEDVKKYFEVTTRAVRPEAGEPKDTEYLRLATRDEYKKEINFVTLEMWLDPKTHLPMKFITAERNPKAVTNKKVTTVTLTDTTTNKEVDPKDFDLPRPTEPGWNYRVEPLEKAAH